MPKLIILPHPELCPDGAALEGATGETILDIALRNGIGSSTPCEKSCACTTCHCVVREGFDSLEPSDELEDDMLDKAWGWSRNPVSAARPDWRTRIWWWNCPVHPESGVRAPLMTPNYT